ncbi:MAG: hypothetical protein BM485_17880 [Desulfobulbaceae bacterium DB1]|nr:MAG: hypothetical protein BM485_17880 [Desulfobulbaceae bacterium DB1]
MPTSISAGKDSRPTIYNRREDGEQVGIPMPTAFSAGKDSRPPYPTLRYNRKRNVRRDIVEKLLQAAPKSL